VDTQDNHRRLTFLKLGGSLLTEKDREATARQVVIERLAGEIGEVLQADSQLQLLLGHGSGSFGHPPAKRHRTREGVHSDEEWQGFLEVWRKANALHSIVMTVLTKAGIRALSFPPSSSATTVNGEVESIASDPIAAALTRGMVPVVMGDAVFDSKLGGTILSTEQVFLALAPYLKPTRILLAGAETGVYAHYPPKGEPLKTVKRDELEGIMLQGSPHADVTGGMADKVEKALSLLEIDPEMDVRIFSAEQPGALRSALVGEPLGTQIQA
jgi:isopentenyl phosphate kinase